MATGRTHPRHWRLYVDQVDLSGVMRTIGAVGHTFMEEEVTGWSDGIVNFILGQANAFITGGQSVFDNTALGAHAELSAQEEYLVSLHMGIRAAPAVGDPAFASPLGQSNYVVAGDGPVVVSFEMNGPNQDHTIPDKVWGQVLYPPTSISATTNGSSVDLLAASSNGIMAYLHITVADAGGTWTLKVQDSPDDSVWADSITFTADGQTILSEQGIDTASVDRYVRFQATDGGAGSGFTPLVTVVPQ